MDNSNERRVECHPILQPRDKVRCITIYYNGAPLKCIDGEPIAAALMNAGIRSFRNTVKTHQPRGIFCAIGRCTDCMMIVNGIPNTRTCITPTRDGMRVETQDGYGLTEEQRQ